LNAANLKRADAVLIVTDHDGIDYRAIGQGAKLILDTRNRMARAGWRGRNVIKA
jgi:UDP-N-acetyl-D-glucosamine dehydrogenase